MKELKWLREEPKSYVFFFSFFLFYHAFILSRYKKLRAVLAMERTKPINQNISTKETIFLAPGVLTESTWAQTICPSFLFTETKYREVTTLNYFSFTRFFARKNTKGS